MLEELRPGLVGQARTIVDRSNMASTLGSGSVDVFATPAMIALMENAAIDAVERVLPPGWASVGTRVEVRHLAATPAGLEVSARAELIEVDGRRLTFRVAAFDPVEAIGDGHHQRMIVELTRLMARAEAKAAPSRSGK